MSRSSYGIVKCDLQDILDCKKEDVGKIVHVNIIQETFSGGKMTQIITEKVSLVFVGYIAEVKIGASSFIYRHNDYDGFSWENSNYCYRIGS